MGKVKKFRKGKGKPKKREHIFVGIMSISNRITLNLHSFLQSCTMLNSNEKSPWRFTTHLVNGMRPIPYARNVVVKKFLETDADRLLFIDDDMMPTAQSFKLLHNDADICAGRMFIFNHANEDKGTPPSMDNSAFDYNLMGDGKWTTIRPEPGREIISCDAVGTASMLIKRKVLEDRRMWASETNYIGLDGKEYDILEQQGETKFAPPVFRELYRPDNGRLVGSDIWFCHCAKALGYTVTYDVGAPFGHLKSVNLDAVNDIFNRVIAEANKITMSALMRSNELTQNIVAMAPERELPATLGNPPAELVA